MVSKVVADMGQDGVNVRMEITARYGYYLPNIAKNVKLNIEKNLENLTGLVVYDVRVQIKSLDIENRQRQYTSE